MERSVRLMGKQVSLKAGALLDLKFVLKLVSVAFCCCVTEPW